VSLLQELRAATRDVHDRLELDLDVLQRSRSAPSYAALLVGFRSVYRPLEQALTACAATLLTVPDWPQRHKCGWLDADLAALGVGRDEPAADVPAVRTAEDVAGTLYVMEGATLGGAVVVRELAAAFPVLPPHEFFSSYGASRGVRWRDFRRHVEALERRGADRDAVVAAATATFATLERACLQPAAP